MDRDRISLLTQKIGSGFLKVEDILQVIMDYCIEKGKDTSMSQQFVTILLESGKIMEPFLIALEYFQKKFNICILTDIEGKIITTF